MEITFRNPSYLWFLLTIIFLILLHFITLRHTKRRAMIFANFEAMERVTGSEILSKNIMLLYIRILIIVCVILAVAGTTIWYTTKVSNSDFVLAIDASKSMEAQDVQPSRLDVAKAAAVYFVSSVAANTRIGVLSFSGSSFVEQELTDDLIKVRSAIHGIQVKVVGGTDILDAVVTGTDLLFRGGRGARVIILVTDGQINVGSVDDITEYTRKNGVTIYTLGIGTKEGSQLLGNFTNVISTLDEEALKSIAYGSGGTYSSASNQDDLTRAYNSILTSSVARVSFNAAPVLLVVALVLLLIEWVLVNTRYRTLP